MRNRRVNDAQVERLLEAMRSVAYRQQLTRRVLEQEGVKEFTPKTHQHTAIWKRRYSSTMRRFQRYVTESGERRSFARSPVQFQRQTRAVARAVPLPAPRPLPEAEGKRTPTRLEEYYEDIEPELDREPQRDISLYDLRAIVAYYDGEVGEAAKAMRLSDRGERLLDLAVAGEGVDVLAMRGAGEVIDHARELIYSLDAGSVQDINDFHDLLMNLPDWQIGMILADLEDENTTFADWLDAWRNDGMDLDADSSEYWALWRQAYARAKK